MKLEFPNNDIGAAWAKEMASVLASPKTKALTDFLETRKNEGATIYPAEENIFNAFSFKKPSDIRVLIVGQDPYHGPNQAHGLSFSVLSPEPAPPSLKNIMKEVQASLGGTLKKADLTPWAEQGVFLLNTVLTVEKASPASHAGKGWEEITDEAIKVISRESPHCVFLLWGSHAIKKTNLIDASKHLILTSPHPSPLSAHRGFLGNGHFKKANEFLIEKGLKPIVWTDE